jgi:hypothetical protein
VRRPAHPALDDPGGLAPRGDAIVAPLPVLTCRDADQADRAEQDDERDRGFQITSLGR